MSKIWGLHTDKGDALYFMQNKQWSNVETSVLQSLTK